jgi:hypothetical protein
MCRTLRLIPILVVAALVLMLNPNRTPLTWLAVAIATVLTLVLVDDRVPAPADQAQARRWFLYPALAVLVVAPFLLAAFSEYPFRDAVRTASLMAVGPAVALAYLVGIRHFAR